MNYLAILRDSLRETLDRKSLYVVLVIAVLVIVVCASFGFRELDAEGSLRHVASQFNQVQGGRHMHRTFQTFDVQFDVSNVREGERASGHGPAEYDFILTAKPVKQFHRAVQTWNAQETGKGVEEFTADTVPDPGPDLEMKYLRARFREQMMGRVEIEARPGGTDGRSYQVHLRASSRAQLEGAYEISVLFGAWKGRLEISLAFFLTLVEIGVADHIAGFWGVILAIIFTAGFVPGMLQKGTLDLLLAKPVSRPLVLLTKYAGGLFYALIPALALIGGCWLVISFRSGFWNFGFLSSIGVLVVIFAVLYAFTVLTGVLFRSTIASVLLTIGLWFFSWAVTSGYMILKTPQFEGKVPAAITTTLGVVRHGLPRTTEWGQVASYLTMKGNLGPEMEAMREDQERQGFHGPEWLSLIASSAAFIVVMLGLACWRFSRRDY